MSPTVRLTKRSGGGFRVEGAAATPIDGVPAVTGFRVEGHGPWSLTFDALERGWILTRAEERAAHDEVGRTTTFSPDRTIGPASVLLADGRLFRLAMIGASEPRVELGRWDVPGAFIVGRPSAGGWDLARTVAGSLLEAPPELWVLTCAEIGRLDGWF